MPVTKKTKRKKIIMAPELRRFAVEVVEARHAKKLPQLCIADAVGISNKTMNNIERARNWPSVPVLIGLRRTLAGNDRSLLT